MNFYENIIKITFQNQKVKFSGTIKNTSNRPILIPRVKILAVREDRKIILEKVLNLKDKIIMPLSEIKFSEVLEMQLKKENVNYIYSKRSFCNI